MINPNTMKLVGYLSIYFGESKLKKQKISRELTGSNELFKIIAERFKLEPKELMGLIDLLYLNLKSHNFKHFAHYLMKKLKIPENKFRTLRSVLFILLSEDEESILRGIKDLDLENGLFLLFSKEILNPKYIPTEQFKLLGLTRDKYSVVPEAKRNRKYSTWKF